jgi:hypothetical protein
MAKGTGMKQPQSGSKKKEPRYASKVDAMVARGPAVDKGRRAAGAGKQGR